MHACGIAPRTDVLGRRLRPTQGGEHRDDRSDVLGRGVWGDDSQEWGTGSVLIRVADNFVDNDLLLLAGPHSGMFPCFFGGSV